MATFDCVDFGGDLNSGQSIFYLTDSFGSRVQLSQEEVGQLMSWLQSFLAPLPLQALDDKNYEPDNMHEALCLCPFQYAPYRRFGEEIRAQRLIPHLLCELLHSRHRPGKRLVLLLPLPTRIVRFPQCHLDLPQLAWQSDLFC